MRTVILHSGSEASIASRRRKPETGTNLEVRCSHEQEAVAVDMRRLTVTRVGHKVVEAGVFLVVEPVAEFEYRVFMCQEDLGMGHLLFREKPFEFGVPGSFTTGGEGKNENGEKCCKEPALRFMRRHSLSLSTC